MCLFLSLVSKSRKENISEYLLLPDLPIEMLHGPLYRTALLASLWRLRREHPYAVVSQENNRIFDHEEDFQYAHSLPQLQMLVQGKLKRALDVQQGDISLFLPKSEEDFILFLPAPPQCILPCWPEMITQLDGVLISQSDEFIKLQTINQNIMHLIDRMSPNTAFLK